MKHLGLSGVVVLLWATLTSGFGSDRLASGFVAPPPSARPWVYWYFMDGNMTREGLTADLEAMRDAGIGGAIFLEVDLGVPRGPVKFMSPEWRQLFVHAVHEAERLGIEIALGSGPGWCGTGGPWVKPAESMQHLVSSETKVSGPGKVRVALARPQPRTPFFGENTLTPELAKAWREYYEDVAVLAFPTPNGDRRLGLIDEKALYQRAPYSSAPNVRSSLATAAEPVAWPADECIAQGKIIDLTGKMTPEGELQWEAPPGQWTIQRLGRTATGQITRPAPQPGLGFETDKFSTDAIKAHFDQYVGVLLKEIGPRKGRDAGLTTLHFDSWEMSAQNWSGNFRREFQRRRGYDPLPFLPAYSGRVVGSVEITERFLWDVRQTAQELVIEKHAVWLRFAAQRHGLKFSMEPYDMNPASDLALGAVADVPMCEFWWLGFDATYSVIEAASLAHTGGRSIVGAEAFTSQPGEDWQAYPENMKSLGDWAFGAGVNRIVFHRYQHQPWLNRYPGMRMRSYGVHWERTQTWWPMVSAYHRYLARCQYLLRQGTAVADILFLAPEGAPHVFRPSPSATEASPPDRRGYNFDGCAPETLLELGRASEGRLAFPGGTSYRLLVLPQVETMTPQLLRKLRDLSRAGVKIVGQHPERSPSLSGYPKCDAEVQRLVAELWDQPAKGGHAAVLWGSEFASSETSAKAPQPLRGASWIWLNEGNPVAEAPIATRYFRRTLEVPASSPVDSAVVYITADNEFVLTVNGIDIGKGANFHRIENFDISKILRPGANSLLVTARNTGADPNPAGMIAVVEIRLHDGREVRCTTDRTWQAGGEAEEPGQPARELGPVGMSPWRTPTPANREQDISVQYPDYPALAGVLRSMGVPPDFESDGPLRYTHRQAGSTDLYFVANRADRFVEATSRFRVDGRLPEIWDPVRGTQQPAARWTVRDGRTEVTLRLAPFESCFVVFRKAAQPPTVVAKAVDAEELLPLSGPWEVQFDPKWGGPEKITFASLEDWSRHADLGIRYYSGRATYRKTFEARTVDKSGARLMLDLGKVKNLAQVRLNGRDLGVVWTAPWQVDVTEALRPGANSLEVTVANLWINRLIRDAGLPESERLTWTTTNPYRATTPLVESGLLGPVKILRTTTGR